ncbi:baeRF11 domain-containing protein [Tomitella biformata]|uniref:baeRF11 domain-containing protein n=1 Tax=Tomitella biformata TaxID=630403 RepID=UPI0004641887|nr:hypothetical protein [Tomitella biformata]
MVHTDIPSQAEIADLASAAGRTCISIYTPTADNVQDHDRVQREFAGQVRAALAQVENSAERATLEQSLEGLTEWSEFWRYQSRTLVVHATTERIRSYRLPNRLDAVTFTGDRFYIKPMLRTASFPQTAFVLALAEGAVRLVLVSADQPAVELSVPGLPTDLETLLGTPGPSGHGPGGRLHSPDARKTRIRQFSRAVDHALRTTLIGHGIPLILAAADPIASIYRSTTTYPGLLAQGIDGNPQTLSDADLADAARKVLDSHYRDELFDLRKLFDERRSQGRGLTDVADVAKAATYGAISTVLVNIERVVPGTVDPETGDVHFAENDGAQVYGVVDEITRRALLAGAKVTAVRGEDMPDGAEVAAILRYRS